MVGGTSRVVKMNSIDDHSISMQHELLLLVICCKFFNPYSFPISICLLLVHMQMLLLLIQCLCSVLLCCGTLLMFQYKKFGG